MQYDPCQSVHLETQRSTDDTGIACSSTYIGLSNFKMGCVREFVMRICTAGPNAGTHKLGMREVRRGWGCQ